MSFHWVRRGGRPAAWAKRHSKDSFHRQDNSDGIKLRGVEAVGSETRPYDKGEVFSLAKVQLFSFTTTINAGNDNPEQYLIGKGKTPGLSAS